MTAQQQPPLPLCLPPIIEDKKQGKKYQTSNVLGKGGFAAVFKVTDMETNEVYACKVTPIERLSKPKLVEKFKQELKIHKQLDFQYICKAHSFFQDKTNYYLLLEICEAYSLSQLFRKRNGLIEEEIQRISYEILSALAYLKNLGIIHRDLKASNVFLKKANGCFVTKLGDFGLSAQVVNNELRYTLCGTPNFLSPEIIASHVAKRLANQVNCDVNIDIDCKKLCQDLPDIFQHGHGFATDVWSLGCVIYQLAFVKAPFESLSIPQTYKKILNCDYTFPKDVQSQRKYSQYFYKFISSMLSKNPQNRPTVEQLLLDPWIQSGKSVRLIGLPEQVMKSDLSINYLQSQPMQKFLKYKESVEQRCAKIAPLNDLFPQASSQTQTLQQFLSQNFSTFTINQVKYQTPDITKIQPWYGCQFTSHNITPIGTDPFDDYERAGHFSHNMKLPYTRFHQVQYIYAWCDYSSQYGIAYQISTGSIGALFNDLTSIVISPSKVFGDYTTERSIVQRFSYKNGQEVVGNKKWALIVYFADLLETRSIAPILKEQLENVDQLFIDGELAKFYNDAQSFTLEIFNEKYAKEVAKIKTLELRDSIQKLSQAGPVLDYNFSEIENIFYDKLCRYAKEPLMRLKKWKNDSGQISFYLYNDQFQCNNQSDHTKIVINQTYLILLNESRQIIIYNSQLIYSKEFIDSELYKYITQILQNVTGLYQELTK
ncbi:Serine/threonine-protein kinase PLK [Spironucleus salmonicida]|uniref:Serine/threonine-protein kinase PLK n=1 Tax=Spironucleus salmonicida TaxID=348837 RepID=V6LKC8_9EUKA|nr:Serine/threonine-protein kinase PLK [Spironucleus salmonicida]|eukprot:EST45095.1 Kinase, PLK [Spironucleus salmonicida]